MNKKEEACSYERFYETEPKYKKEIQPFGYVGIAKKNEGKFQNKLENKGIPCMMLGYASSNASGTYRLLNFETNRVFKSRNVLWLNMSYEQ